MCTGIGLQHPVKLTAQMEVDSARHIHRLATQPPPSYPSMVMTSEQDLASLCIMPACSMMLRQSQGPSLLCL